MDAHGRIPSAHGGRTIQAPGMMRHGPLPGLGPSDPHIRDPLPLELLEKKVVIQGAEMEKLARENQRLASSNVTMRQELVATQKEMQSLQAHLGNIRSESDIKVRGLLEKLGKMEADIYAGDVLKMEFQQAHSEAQRLFIGNQELTAEMKLVTEELETLSVGTKKLPDLQSELDGLRQEHQKLRTTFEYEKGRNVEQVERMRSMERNLMSMASEIEKLRAEIASAQQRTAPPNAHGHAYPQAANQYGATYPPPQAANQHGGAYPPAAGHALVYAGGYGTGLSYTDAGFDYANSSYYSEAYGRPHTHISGTPAEGIIPYSGTGNLGSMNTYRGP
ncbi:protein FLX-like 4 [Zingiber officinale]|uniref:Protein FLX-like 2 n=1 Tax=Zingiber officinale TaxID=94328 RepID=A0A8J5L8M4_ZINOF|nr:protein FLX-like 4 [Zingiber officinale]XP_042394838.1 protein FLX-like 4 [Zingiber officinale]KAG6504670.1 hypothetical protein ZIOFF_037006 [Zingiber officinale]